MKAEKRNATLIRIAKDAVKKYAPDYYREYKEPIIEKGVFDDKLSENEEFGLRFGRVYYEVIFPYDERKEYFGNDYSSLVAIWGDTGELRYIFPGNGNGRTFRKRNKKTHSQEEDFIIPYVKRERPKHSNVTFPEPPPKIMVKVPTVKEQGLYSLPIAQRDSTLKAIAKLVILAVGPDYYREYKEPVIEEYRLIEAGDFVDRKCYDVIYLYDKTKEHLRMDFAAKVTIWAFTGKPKFVQFGNGLGVSLTREEVTMIPYEQVKDR